MSTRPNGSTARAAILIKEHGGWVNGKILREMMSISASSASNALSRVANKADDWCGIDGWEERMESGNRGGRHIKITHIIPGAINGKSRVDLAFEFIQKNPDATSADVANHFGWDKKSASCALFAAKKHRINGEKYRSRGKFECPHDRAAYRAHRRFSEVWPVRVSV